MSTLNERLNSAVTQIETDSGLFHDIVHGDDTTVVTTEGGDINSAAKTISDLETAINDAGTGWLTLAQTAASSAATDAGDAATDAAAADDSRIYSSYWATYPEDSLIPVAAGGDGSTDYSAYHWAQKALLYGGDKVSKAGDTMTGTLAITAAAATSTININAATGQDSLLQLSENSVKSVEIINDASASTFIINKYDATGATVQGAITFDESGNVNVSTGTLQQGGVDVATVSSTQTFTTKTIVVASNTITTAASGNLTSTELNAALAELQTDIDTRQITITGAATTITSANLTADRALISSGTGKVAISAVTATELGYVSGVTSSLQTQLGTLTTDVANCLTKGKHTIWMLASGMLPDATNPPLLTDNVLYFDSAADELAEFDIFFPKSWDGGTVKFTPVWKHSSGGTAYGVSWWVHAKGLDDGTAESAAYGSPQESADTGGTADTIYEGAESAAITIGGTLSAPQLVRFQIYRDVSDADDTLDIDAGLIGVAITYTIDAGDDT